MASASSSQASDGCGAWRTLCTQHTSRWPCTWVQYSFSFLQLLSSLARVETSARLRVAHRSGLVIYGLMHLHLGGRNLFSKAITILSVATIFATVMYTCAWMSVTSMEYLVVLTQRQDCLPTTFVHTRLDCIKPRLPQQISRHPCKCHVRS